MSRLAIWLRFPVLPVEFFEEGFLLKIERLIRKPLKVDLTTLSAVRARFAQMCIDIDLNKPLLSKFRLKREVHIVEYEALHMICFACGCYGHGKEDCPIVVVV